MVDEAEFFPSHFLVRTTDLASAVADFRDAGFVVTWGSDPGEAYNALIHFERGGFIELIDPPLNHTQRRAARDGARHGDPLMQRYHRWVTATGFCDHAIETPTPLAEAIQGKELPGVVPSSRVRPDGTTTRWELSFPFDDPYLPFLMGPYDPPQIPTPEETTHPNGITAITGIRLSHPTPGPFGVRLAALLGNASMEEQDPVVTVRKGEFTYYIGRAQTAGYWEILVDPFPSGLPTSQASLLDAGSIHAGDRVEWLARTSSPFPGGA